MANHPINLALRFILELVALFAFGYWGWTQHDGLERVLWTVGLPLVAALVWGIFRVPDDPGKATVPISGIGRLLIEAAVFVGAIWAFFDAGQETWGMIFGIVVLLHYLFSYDRVLWLLQRR